MELFDLLLALNMLVFGTIFFVLGKLFEVKSGKYVIRSWYMQHKGVGVTVEKVFSYPDEAELFYVREVERLSKEFNLDIVEVVESLDGMTTYFVYNGENIGFVEAEELEE